MFVAYASTQRDAVGAMLARLSHSSRPWQVVWSEAHSLGAVTGSSSRFSQPYMAAVGNVSLERGSRDAIHADLREAVSAAAAGGRAVGELAGKFGFATWNRRLMVMEGYCDQFGLAPVYWTSREGGILMSDDLEFLAGTTLDLNSVRHLLVSGQLAATATMWSDVNRVSPGSSLRWTEGRTSAQQYFSWLRSRLDVPDTHEETVAECRRLMLSAVDSQIEVPEETWSDLSGGHDSSSVASIAAWLSRARTRTFGGTLTLNDSIGEGDETKFAQTVTDKYELRSLIVNDACPWEVDGEVPVTPALPSRDFGFWVRDRQISSALASRGGRRLLSGIGPDFYLPLTPSYALDYASAGRLSEAWEVFCDWTIKNRSNFWEVAARELVVPMLPVAVQQRILAFRPVKPRWIRNAFLDSRQFAARAIARDVAHHWPGSMNIGRVAQRLGEIGPALDGWRNTWDIDIRHPFLSMPLVRFCLSLGREFRTDYERPKPILRWAMQGIVPQAVLDRHTKGSLVLPRVCWAFRHQRKTLEALLSDSILAELGAIEPTSLLAAIEDCALGRAPARHVYFALSLETWLSARAARAKPFAA